MSEKHTDTQPNTGTIDGRNAGSRAPKPRSQ